MIDILTYVYLCFIIYIMEKSWILVFDSGTGGKYTMEQIRKILPNENYLLFMDKTNCPYGNKPKNKLKNIITSTIKKIKQKYDLKLIVIACNTLSSMFACYLQKIFKDTPFVFVLPSTEKQILLKPTLFLVTKNTARYNKDLKIYKKQKNIWVLGFDNLAKMIDDCAGNYDVLQAYLNKKLKKFKNKKPVNIILGCTHFNYITKQIKKSLGYEIDFYENSQNVAKKVKQMLIATGKLSRKKSLGDLLTIYHI